jgi:hypothetical protein
MREFTGLVRKDSVAGVVDVGVHVAKFVAFELGGLEVFKRNGLRFSGADIFPALIEMAFWSFHSFGEVFLDVANSEQQPSYEVASVDSFEPGGLDQVSANGGYPFDGLLGGRQVVNTVGLLQGVACFLG